MSNFDALLHRKIKNGLEFNAYFPVVRNSKTTLGFGDTHHSVKKMREWVLQYYPQTAKISAILQRSNLKDTILAIYEFLYNHIQYKQDYTLQQLRSPANSWLNRSTGLDCKSFSIFASCILTSLGFKHYIRQIKQPTFKPSRYTHVYVVVPYDQTTGKLDNGYYVIDATVSNNKEPFFIEKNDMFMDKLPHVGLNGTTSRKPQKKKKPVARKKATKTKQTVTKPKKVTKSKKSNTVTNTVIGLGALAVVSQLFK